MAVPMIDVVSSEVRSRMMSGIRGKNTKPELTIRRYLHARGFRFRLHRKDLPGRPDLVLQKYKCVVLVHGCFWHRHPGCAYATKPITRHEFWADKFEENIIRDAIQINALQASNWRVLVVWECGLKRAMDKVEQIDEFITGDAVFMNWPVIPPKPKTT